MSRLRNSNLRPLYAKPFTCLLLLVLAIPFRSAVAHPRLVRAVPVAGSHVAAPPRELTLAFSEALTIALSRLTLLDAVGQPITLDTPRFAPADTKTLTVQILGSMPAGRYTVKWQAAGADGHSMQGEYTFVVDAGAAKLTTSETKKAPKADVSGPNASVQSPGYVVIRAVLSIALVGLIGIIALRLVVWPRFARQATTNEAAMVGELNQAARRWATALLWIISVATVARLIAQHAVFFGTRAPWTRASLSALLLQSGWGQGWWLALGATIVGFWGTRRIRLARPGGWTTLATAAVALAASVAMSGHSAAAATLAMTVHTLHVLGAGGWVGSLAALMLVAVPVVLRLGGETRHEQVAGLVRAFSPTALGFAGLLIVTGAVAAWRNIGSVAGLWQEPYGQVLLVKLALLSVAAGTGAYNWRRVLPFLGSVAATTHLRKSATLELMAALVVLVVTAVLVATPMPSEMLDKMVR